MSSLSTTLSNLALEGNIEELKFEFEKDNLLINKKDEDGRTLLHWTITQIPLVSGGHLELTKYLISLGSDISVADEAGWTCLHIAAGRTELVSLLLEKDEKLALSSNDKGLTPLFYATSKNYQDIAQKLLNAKSNIRHQDSLGQTVLHRAASMGRTKLLSLFLANKAPINIVDNLGNTPLHLACEEGREDEIRILLAKGADPDKLNKDGQTPAELASSELKKLLFSQ